MQAPSPVSIILTEMEIPHQEFIHPGPIQSLEQAAAERNQTIYQVVRSIVFRLAEDQYAMALIAGPFQVSWKALRKHFNRNRLTIASPDEVQEITGYEIGAVAPFGLKTEIPILLDEGIQSQPAISLGSGVRGTAILMTIDNFLKALGDVETGQFTKA